MTEQEQKKAAKDFAAYWNSQIGDEDSETQDFWNELIKDVLGETTKKFIEFNQPVKFFDEKGKKHSGKYDAIIKTTKVLIEQKTRGINLNSKYPQADGAILTPFEQAKRYVEGYNAEHKFSDWIKWVVVCDFYIFRIYDVRYENALFFKENPQFQLVTEFKLLDLPNKIDYLKFLVDSNDDTVKFEAEISKKATEIVSNIYETLEPDYTGLDIQFLNKLCTRLVFLYYANDSKLIDNDLLRKYFNAHNYTAETLRNLFEVLDKAENLRDENLSAELKNFPYVNGGLFKDPIKIPKFSSNADWKIKLKIKNVYEQAKIKKFAWQYIDPTIFGALFEGILGDKQRRKSGMHYTSPENIHKVIDPLFLNELHDEFKHAKNAHKVNRPKLLRALHEKLANMIFFDPACGSGNFLTETYLSLRRLENKIINELHKGNVDLFDEDPIKVKISQFFGIEINSYAVEVAQVALWISENQMFQATEAILGPEENSGLPLKNYSHIVQGNALQIDWNTVLPKDKLNGKKIFIIGNPPFVGYTYQTSQQKQDLLDATHLNFKKIDYVTAWYFKAADFIQGTDIHCAFVSTNSITQGEQVAVVWKPLFKKIHFDFAYRTFKWTSDSDKVAAVHCVIIGFSAGTNRKNKFIFDGKEIIKAKNINAYLIDGANIFVESRTKPICNVPEMTTGNRPADGGHLIIEVEDYDYFINKEPRAKKYIKNLIGADEFIKGKRRYCLWLVGVSLEEILTMPLVAIRVEDCCWDRLSGAPDRQKLANTPHIFRETFNPKNFILVPETSSENRRYIPMGFFSNDTITTNSTHIIPDATIYHFGILISSVHMAWTRAVCGRLESRYRYSKDIVYNNFAWCDCTAEQRAEIERTAQKILDVLATFEGKTLAYLYDEKTMPFELRAAHLANDKAVLRAYGFSETLSESEIVSALFEKYAALTRGGGGR